MNNAMGENSFFDQIVTSIRIVFATMVICCLLYTLLILGIGQALTPHTANGSLIRNGQGEIVGSESLAQGFSRPDYFWPRPSAVDYNAAATGGSNLSPANPALRERAQQILLQFGEAAGEKIPPDLVTASGSGMDPHITLKAAEYQAKRVALARGLPLKTVLSLLDKQTRKSGGFLTPQPVVNVLRLNMELDRLGQ
ncbi:MAG: potassium-transporting ATPase subunit KdpC [Kiritimatiellales bacterium]